MIYVDLLVKLCDFSSLQANLKALEGQLCKTAWLDWQTSGSAWTATISTMKTLLGFSRHPRAVANIKQPGASLMVFFDRQNLEAFQLNTSHPSRRRPRSNSWNLRLWCWPPAGRKVFGYHGMADQARVKWLGSLAPLLGGFTWVLNDLSQPFLVGWVNTINQWSASLEASDNPWKVYYIKGAMAACAPWRTKRHIVYMIKTWYVVYGHPSHNRNPYDGDLNPYQWLDDPPLPWETKPCNLTMTPMAHMMYMVNLPLSGILLWRMNHTLRRDEMLRMEHCGNQQLSMEAMAASMIYHAVQATAREANRPTTIDGNTCNKYRKDNPTKKSFSYFFLR